MLGGVFVLNGSTRDAFGVVCGHGGPNGMVCGGVICVFERRLREEDVLLVVLVLVCDLQCELYNGFLLA